MVHQSHPAIGKLDPGGAHFEIAFVLEEIEMPVALGLRIVNRMQPFRALIGKAAAFLEIDGDGHEPLAGVEPHVFDIPGLLDAKRRREKLVAHFPPAVSQGIAALAAIRMPPCSQPSRTSPAGGRSESGHS